MAVIKCAFEDGRLTVLEVLRVQQHDTLILENGECVEALRLPLEGLPPADINHIGHVPCPDQVRPKGP